MWSLLLALCLPIEIFCFYCLLVGIVAKFALGNPKRNSEGGLRIKKESFVIKYLFRNNLWIGIDEEIRYPRNDCQIIRGFFWGIPFGIVGVSIFFVTIMVILNFFGFIFGFLTAKVNSSNFYREYQTYGKNNEKKFIAPWKFLLPIGVVYFFYAYWDKTIEIVYSFGVTTGKVSYTVDTSSIFWAIIVLVAFVVLLKNFFSKGRGAENWVVIKNWFTSAHRGLCLKTEIVDE